MAIARETKTPVIADVARLAGVSVPTVSRVLTGSAKVSAEKRTRVLDAIDELRFRPNPAARALVFQKPKIIAVLAGNTSRYGNAETIRGIEETARVAGYIVTITVVEAADPDSVERAVGLVIEQPIAGVIVLKFDPTGIETLRHIPHDIPTVAISGLREPGIPQARLDEAAGADELTQHLLGLGHATVHHVRVPPSLREDSRTAGWRRALVRAGITPPPIIAATWEPESGRRVGLALAGRDDVTAVYCGNDEIAMGVIRGLVEAGKRVPEDISVVGFDDHPLAAMWSPPITTVRQDFAELGSRSFDMLMKAISGDRAARYSSRRPTVVIRESSAPPRQGR